MFPAMVLCTRRLPSLRRVPASPVPRLHRYYEAATTSRVVRPSAYVFASGFRPGSKGFVSASALPAMLELIDGPGALITRSSHFPGVSKRTCAGPLRFPGDPSCAFALLEDPDRTDQSWPWRIDRRRPRAQHGEGFGASMISRLPQGFSARCLRFTSAVTAAHARLASGWRAPPLPGGCRTLWVASKGFRSHHPPFQGFP